MVQCIPFKNLMHICIVLPPRVKDVNKKLTDILFRFFDMHQQKALKYLVDSNNLAFLFAFSHLFKY